MGKALCFKLDWQFYKGEKGVPASRSNGESQPHHGGMSLALWYWDRQWGPGALATSLSFPFSLLMLWASLWLSQGPCVPQSLLSLPSLFSLTSNCVLLITSLLYPVDFLHLLSGTHITGQVTAPDPNSSLLRARSPWGEKA